MFQNSVPIILGPTSSGKSELALALARCWKADIISVDSMKVYRGMDIGTAKPGAAQLQEIHFDLIDIRNPDESYNAFEFYEDCCLLLQQKQEAGTAVLLEGGTGQYFWNLIEGIFQGPEADWDLRQRLEVESLDSGDPEYLHRKLSAVDPVAASRTHYNNTRRIIRALEVFELTGKPISELQNEATKPAPFHFRMIGLQWPRQTLYERINQRVESMFDEGLMEEVVELTAKYAMSRQALQAVGYKEILQCIRGQITREQAKEQVQQNTRNFAKHQHTWFRKWDAVQWIDASSQDPEQVLENSLSYFGKA